MYFKIYHFKKIQSTNNHAIKMIKNNHLKGIILADEQTKGRGRQGNKWISLKGNLFMSLFFKIKRSGILFSFQLIPLIDFIQIDIFF